LSAPAVTAPASPAAKLCASVIAEVQARGLFPAPGFQVVCPGDALGHMGYTCLNNATVCPGTRRIVVQYIAAFVVANEFENSWIMSGEGTPRCVLIDCGHLAYGF
jgi:hypothetical protein